jgi:hypothetical protein
MDGPKSSPMRWRTDKIAIPISVDLATLTLMVRSG